MRIGVLIASAVMGIVTAVPVAALQAASIKVAPLVLRANASQASGAVSRSTVGFTDSAEGAGVSRDFKIAALPSGGSSLADLANATSFQVDSAFYGFGQGTHYQIKFELIGSDFRGKTVCEVSDVKGVVSQTFSDEIRLPQARFREIASGLNVAPLHQDTDDYLRYSGEGSETRMTFWTPAGEVAVFSSFPGTTSVKVVTTSAESSGFVYDQTLSFRGAPPRSGNRTVAFDNGMQALLQYVRTCVPGLPKP
jgi:hypothetical protein